MTYKDLIGLHFGVLSTIRNAYKLLKPKGQLLQPCGVGHLNDETGAVIYLFWERQQYGFKTPGQLLTLVGGTAKKPTRTNSIWNGIVLGSTPSDTLAFVRIRKNSVVLN